MTIREKIAVATAYVAEKLDGKQADIGMILGSGLGDYADGLENPIKIPYADIPGFLTSTVEGHAGQFIIGEKHGKTVLAMQGRFHFYEGYSQQEITIPVRMMHKLGIKTLLITNAAGGVNVNFGEGALMLITDHINFAGTNPLMGENLDEFGPRFPDMSTVYSPKLREKLRLATDKAGISLEQGVYMMFSGPCYETPAEVRFARFCGADAVGMSTVPEATVAAHCGMDVVGISCITNMAAGVLDQPLDHGEVVEVANRVKSTFTKVLDLLVGEVI